MADHPKDAKSIFSNALEIPVRADRNAYLQAACADDASLRAEIEGLLAALEKAGKFLQQPSASERQTVTVGQCNHDIVASHHKRVSRTTLVKTTP